MKKIIISVLIILIMGFNCNAGKPENFTGLLETFDKKLKTISVQDKKGISLIFNLNDKTLVEKDGKTLTIEALLIGNDISITFRKKKVIKIVVNLAFFNGKVTAVDFVNKKLTIVESKTLKSETYMLLDSTLVFCNHDIINQTKIAKGDTVSIKFDGISILSVNVKVDQKVFSGKIYVLDKNAGTFIASDNKGNKKKFAVAFDTQISRAGKSIKIQHLYPEDYVVVSYTDKKVTSISAAIRLASKSSAKK